MKNVLLIVPRISEGGAEKVAVELYNSFQKNNNVYLIVFETPNSNSYDLEGEPIIIENRFNNNSLLSKLNFVFKCIEVYKLKRDKNIAISISFSDSSNNINVLTRRRDKVISTIHTFRSKRVISIGLRKVLGNFLLKKSNAIVTPSMGVSRDISKIINSNDIPVITIPNPINIKSEENEIIIKSVNKFRVVTMGRLIPEKGHKYLIKAIAKLISMSVDIELTIIGDGPMKNKLINLTLEEKVSEYVTFTGYINNPIQELKKHDVFIMTSIVEGFGNAIVEALACGIPVISTDCDAGPREILAPNTDIYYRTKEIAFEEYGILIPPVDMAPNVDINNFEYDYNYISEAILSLYHNQDKYDEYKNKAFLRAEFFKIENITTMWEKDIFENIKNKDEGDF